VSCEGERESPKRERSLCVYVRVTEPKRTDKSVHPGGNQLSQTNIHCEPLGVEENNQDCEGVVVVVVVEYSREVPECVKAK